MRAAWTGPPNEHCLSQSKASLLQCSDALYLAWTSKVSLFATVMISKQSAEGAKTWVEKGCQSCASEQHSWEASASRVPQEWKK